MNIRALSVVSCCGLAFFAVVALPATYTPGPSRLEPGVSVAESPIFEFHLALGWVKQAADDLIKRWDDRVSTESREGLRQIRDDAELLQARWKSWAADRTRDRPYQGRVKTDHYYRSLQGYQRRLKEVLRSRGVGEVEQAIAEVAADMRLKALNCLHSDDGLGKDIAVHVRTLSGTEEVGGYEIWCVPRALLRFEGSHIRFPRISSPSVMANLSPGNYLLWVRKDGTISDRVPQAIGGGGEKQAEVDLLVP
jgi:hypothetical protein